MVLFADKYDEKLMSGSKLDAKIQQNIIDNKHIKKRSVKNHQKKANESKEKPCKLDDKHLTLSCETIPTEQYDNSSTNCQDKSTISNNILEQYYVANSVELQNGKGDKTSMQSDYQYFNSSAKDFDKKICNSIPSLSECLTSQTRKSKKRTYSQTENSVNTCLVDSPPMSLELIERKISNEVNCNSEEYNLEPSAVQNDDIHNIYTSERLVVDKINESAVECGNVTSAVNVKQKNVKDVHIETLNQFSSCIPPSDELLENNVRNVPIVSRYMDEIENSRTSFVNNKQHLFSDHIDSYTKNSGHMNSEIYFNIHGKDILNALHTENYCQILGLECIKSWLENSEVTNSKYLIQYDSKVVTRKRSKSNSSRKRRRKKFKSREFVEESDNSNEEQTVSNAASLNKSDSFIFIDDENQVKTATQNPVTLETDTNLTMLKEVQVVLHDCLHTENSFGSLSPKELTKNSVAVETDTKQQDCILRETSPVTISDIPLAKIREKLKSAYNASMPSKDSRPTTNAGISLLQNATDNIQECGKVSNSSGNLQGYNFRPRRRRKWNGHDWDWVSI